MDGWTFQHRQASGHGGRGKKAPRLVPSDGLLLCALCNMRCESDYQEIALLAGWKLRRNTRVPSWELPYRDNVTGLWWLPDRDGFRMQVTRREALRRLEGGGNMPRKRVA